MGGDLGLTVRVPSAVGVPLPDLHRAVEATGRDDAVVLGVGPGQLPDGAVVSLESGLCLVHAIPKRRNREEALAVTAGK